VRTGEDFHEDVNQVSNMYKEKILFRLM